MLTIAAERAARNTPGDIAASLVELKTASRTGHGLETTGTIMRTGAFPR
jgi:hypothetical protein